VDRPICGDDRITERHGEFDASRDRQRSGALQRHVSRIGGPVGRAEANTTAQSSEGSHCSLLIASVRWWWVRRPRARHRHGRPQRSRELGVGHLPRGSCGSRWCQWSAPAGHSHGRGWRLRRRLWPAAGHPRRCKRFNRRRGLFARQLLNFSEHLRQPPGFPETPFLNLPAMVTSLPYGCISAHRRALR
jgi:hypothetical protein